MISYHRFVTLLHNLFCRPVFLNSLGFNPNFSTDYRNFSCLSGNDYVNDSNGSCVWWHEEPLNPTDLDNLTWRGIDPNNAAHLSVFGHHMSLSPHVPGITDAVYDINFNLFANSEKSVLKRTWLKSTGYYDWYFFFHGFASLDWFRDYKYLTESTVPISKLFISLNHLMYKNRSYRLTLLSHMYEANLVSEGFISAPLACSKDIKNELYDLTSLLSKDSKRHIFKNLLPKAESIKLDDVDSYSFASADPIDFKYSHGALWHVVTETIFYEEKLHLTEKIFKPIVTKRPFILVGARKNLEYLKSYGFKTFDRWIDESYDDETDPDLRIQKIICELKKLKEKDLIKMHNEMLSILEYNRQHFFGKFEEIIIDEMIDNFKKCVFLYDQCLTGRFRFTEENLDYNKIKHILMQN